MRTNVISDGYLQTYIAKNRDNCNPASGPESAFPSIGTADGKKILKQFIVEVFL